jgi:hypothetical protein
VTKGGNGVLVMPSTSMSSMFQPAADTDGSVAMRKSHLHGEAREQRPEVEHHLAARREPRADAAVGLAPDERVAGGQRARVAGAGAERHDVAPRSRHR